MDIKCCGISYEEGGDNTAWTEAVLFKDGCEIAVSDPSDNYFETWTLYDGDTEYVVEVIEGTAETEPLD